MEAVWNWFAWLYQEHGINLVVFYNSYDRGMFFNGLYLTVQMSVICIILSISALAGVVISRTQGLTKVE